jgi:hypothetical protein
LDTKNTDIQNVFAGYEEADDSRTKIDWRNL